MLHLQGPGEEKAGTTVEGMILDEPPVLAGSMGVSVRLDSQRYDGSAEQDALNEVTSARGIKQDSGREPILGKRYA
jgi:hypothetical protein